MTWPDSNYVQYHYDPLNRVDQVQLNGSTSGNNLIAAYSYDSMSRRTRLDRGAVVGGEATGGTTTYGYSPASRLTALTLDLEASGTANDASWAFGYNPAGQAVSRNLVWAYEHSVDALSQSYTSNGLNQYTAVGGATFAYTGSAGARGNLTSDGSRAFAYDYENRLTSVSGSASGAISYDPLGRIHSYTTGGTTTEFLYDGDRLVAEYLGSTVARRYAHGPGVDEPLMWYEGGDFVHPNWLIADRQGSIIATTDAGGAATLYNYGPYGEPQAWSGPGGAMLSRFRYTGQIALPELQLDHYKARVYDPALGRFLQTDPVGYQSDLNLYAYVSSDPLNQFDAAGTEPLGQFINQTIQTVVTQPIHQMITAPLHEGTKSIVNIAQGHGTARDVETVAKTYGVIAAGTLGGPLIAEAVEGPSVMSAGVTRGQSSLGGIVSSRTNAAGGTVVTAEGDVLGSDFHPFVQGAVGRGENVTVLSGVHGSTTGAMTPDASLLAEDNAAYAGQPNVTVRDVSTMSPSEVRAAVNGPGTTVGAFCNSAACLADH